MARRKRKTGATVKKPVSKHAEEYGESLMLFRVINQLTQEDLLPALGGGSVSKVSELENGHVADYEAKGERYLRSMGLDRSDLDSIMALAKRVRAKSLRSAPSPARIDDFDIREPESEYLFDPEWRSELDDASRVLGSALTRVLEMLFESTTVRGRRKPTSGENRGSESEPASARPGELAPGDAKG